MVKLDTTNIEIKVIDNETATMFIMPRHYAGRRPSISYAFGMYVNRCLQAVVTYGKPASPSVCKNLCGPQNADRVYELNRLCRDEECTVPMSYFVSKTLKLLSPLDLIIVSYADSGMHHHGYIYQATNFLYTGMTCARLDSYAGDGKHSRHAKCGSDIKVVRTQKYRYVYFCTNNKKLKKRWETELKYPIQPYPKGDNQNYEYGFRLSGEIIGEVKTPIYKPKELF